MKYTIIANHKMFYNQEETKSYLNELIPLLEKNVNRVIICFPFTNLSLANDMLFGSKIEIGAQNVHQEESGQYTGEISAKMLQEMNCKAVIVGHSERKVYYDENDKTINEKIKILLKYGMKAILCVGETLQERQTSRTKQVLKSQIEQALSGLYENELKNVIVAYEPVWAVGTGKSATVKQIQESISHVRNIIGQNFSEKAGANICVVYGGSIKPDNAKTIFTIDGVNGALVGNASLNAEAFAKIILK